MDSVANTSALPVKILLWKPLIKNTLRGFATIQLGALRIIDVSVHALNEKTWCAMPGKPIFGANDVVQRDDRGRIKYVPVLEWLDPDTAARFRQGVLDALERDYPGALTAG